MLSHPTLYQSTYYIRAVLAQKTKNFYYTLKPLKIIVGKTCQSNRASILFPCKRRKEDEFKLNAFDQSSFNSLRPVTTGQLSGTSWICPRVWTWLVVSRTDPLRSETCRTGGHSLCHSVTQCPALSSLPYYYSYKWSGL